MTGFAPHVVTLGESMGIVRGIRATGLLLKETHLPGRSIVTYSRADSAGSRLSRADVAELDVGSATLLHVTGITPALSASASDAVETAIEAARAAGVAISFDVNHRARLWGDRDAAPVLRRIAERATIVFAGADEAALLPRRDAPSFHRRVVRGPVPRGVPGPSRGRVRACGGSPHSGPVRPW